MSNQINTVDKVKHLYEMGFALLWLYPKSKRPIGDDWQKGTRKSWDKLKFDYKSPMNVGVRLGEASCFPDQSYLCVLDCDVKSSDPIHLKEMEKALYEFCPAYEFAPRVLSGRGGGSCHIYFRTKNPQHSFKALRSAHKVKVYMPSVSASKVDIEGLTDEEINAGYRMRLAWEIDVFGEGKQVVLPPSTHPDTLRPYEWEYELHDWRNIPLHKPFAPTKVREQKKSGGELKFENVDLFTTPLSEKFFNLIASGQGFEKYPSRSEAIYSCLNAMVMAGLTDGQIISTLTDPDFFMSEKAIEAGQGDRIKSGRWVQRQLDKVREDHDTSHFFKDNVIIDDMDEILALTDEEAERQMDELTPWVDKLERSRAGYKNTAYNLYLILKNLKATDPAAQCLFAYDEFNQANIYTYAPPWGSNRDIGQELVDLDDIKIQTWLSKEWGIEVAENRIAGSTLQLGKENAFHPVQRYLKSLKWDGKERIDSMFTRYCGAEGDATYLADVGRKFMAAAVSRVMHPGIKYDYMVVLEGDQGIGKSTFVNILGSPWYSDTLGDISNKDVVDNMRGKWIIELGELASMNRADTRELKAFISRQQDVARKAYGRRSQNYPRQCVFVGSTNDDEYLKDETGGRRFWPVKTFKYDFNTLKKDRDQLWAEAFVVFSLGESLYLDDDRVRRYAEGEQAGRFMIDEIQTRVETIVEGEDFPETFSFEDVWGRMAIDLGKQSHSPCDYPTQLRIKKSLRVLGFPKIRSRVYGRGYVWKKERETGFKTY
jgi:predicted P-loop ATPase